MSTTPSNPVQSCQPIPTHLPCRHGLSEDCPACMSARIEELEKALREIRDHPEKSVGNPSYAVGWAFWNIQNIARAVLQPKGAAV